MVPWVMCTRVTLSGVLSHLGRDAHTQVGRVGEQPLLAGLDGVREAFAGKRFLFEDA